MSDVATALLQLIGRTEPAADPALAALKLARASLDALVLRLGQSIDAKVTAQLAGGLTQLAAGGESFVLKLETPLPVNTAVTLSIATTPTGQPTVTVTVQAPPQVAQPVPPAPQPVTPMPPPVTQPLQPGTPPQQPVMPLPQPALSTTASAPAAPLTIAHPPTPAPSIVVAAAPPQPSVPVQPSNISAQPPAVASSAAPTQSPPAPALTTQPAAAAVLLPQTAPQVSPVASAPAPPAPSAVPAPAPPIPATTAPAPPSAASGASPTVVLPAPVATSVPPAIAPAPQPTPLVAAPAQPIVSSPTLLPAQAAILNPAPLAPTAPTSAMPAVVPLPTPTPALPGPSPTPQVAVPAGPGSLPAAAPLAPSPRPTPPLSPPLIQILADPVQAAARQDSVLPLLARLATLTAPTAAALPRPAIEALAMLLGTRLDLNRAPPDGKAVRDAVLRAGIITEPGTRTPADAKSALLQLRSALSGFLGASQGGSVEAVAPVTRRPPPPLKGEPVRAPSSQPASPLPDEPVETARQLLGHADAALSRTKLLQLASNPTDAARPAIAAPTAEFRVEVPMQLGAETGILQLLVQRDGKHKRSPAERGWRMRFALNFTATGEVGAEVALFGRSANVSLWAADPDTADALEAMLPELAPALARHGLDVGAVRLRRGAPQPAARVPGQLLDSAR